MNRVAKLKPCLEPTCSAMVPTKANRKRCDTCLRLKWRREAVQARVKRGHRPIDVDQLESSFDIDARFQQALAEIKRRPRPEPMLGWSSPLARLG